MKTILTALLMLLSVVSTADASGRCYSLDEVKAERLLRLHSELMVITVTCKQSTVGRDLVRAYTGFTKQNVKLIRQSEQTLSKYYAANYGGDGLSRLDGLRTKLANQYGQEIADQSAPVFCAQRRDKVVNMFDSPPKSLMDESMKQYASALATEPLCDKSLAVAETSQEAEDKTPLLAQEPIQKAKKTKKKEKS